MQYKISVVHEQTNLVKLAILCTYSKLDPLLFFKKKTDKQTMITYIYTDFRSFSPILNGTEKSVFFFQSFLQKKKYLQRRVTYCLFEEALSHHKNSEKRTLIKFAEPKQI